MANVYAVKSGNWSDTTVWNTGALPTSADDVFANGFIVDINISPTVLSIRNTSAAGINQDGYFRILSGVTLNCTANSGLINGNVFNAVLNCSIATGSCSVIGNLSASIINNTAVSVQTLYFTGAGTLNFTGNIVWGAGGNNRQSVIANSGPGILNITTVGDITNSTQTNALDAVIINTSTGTINITGSLRSAYRNTYDQPIVQNDSTGTVRIFGSITVDSLGTYVIGTGSRNQQTFLSGPFITNAVGTNPNLSVKWRWTSGVGPSYMTVSNSTATGFKNLYTSDSTLSQSGQPSASNVRSGTIYGPASELTGTCAVPAAGSVALGVPVDNTTGTAVLTAANVRTAVGMASANLDTQLDAIPTASENATAVRTELNTELTRVSNCATVATTGQQIQDALI